MANESAHESEITPLQHNACWRGDELYYRPDWQWEFTAPEQQALVQAAEQLGDEFEADAELPVMDGVVDVAAKLTSLRDALENGSGACLVKGFGAAELSEALARKVFWLVGCLVGTPVSQSATGEKIFSVRDAGFPVGHPQARGPNTKKRLSFHTDRCDVISFMCYRQARSGGENQIVSSMAVFNQILAERPDLLRCLMRPYLYQRHNVDLGNQRPYCEQPIFSFCEEHFAGSFLRVLIDRAYASEETPAMNDEQRDALDFLEEVAGRPELHVTFQQEPGDILFLNNWVTLHRREAFEDWPEPERRRHIFRLWLAVPNSRPLVDAFAANYGNVRAGAIRGGMNPTAGQ